MDVYKSDIWGDKGIDFSRDIWSGYIQPSHAHAKEWGSVLRGMSVLGGMSDLPLYGRTCEGLLRLRHPVARRPVSNILLLS